MSTERSSNVEWRGGLDRHQESLRSMAGLVGRKWSPVILHQLLIHESMGFSELKRTVDGISSKMLSDTLEALEETHGLVEREVVEDRPVRVEYSLSERGEAIEPVIAEMRRWADEYLATPDREDQVRDPFDPAAR